MPNTLRTHFEFWVKSYPQKLNSIHKILQKSNRKIQSSPSFFLGSMQQLFTKFYMPQKMKKALKIFGLFCWFKQLL
jgi:hypothetical protein